MQLIRNGQLLTFCCPGTSSDSSPAVCQIHFSIASLRYRLLSFCYVTDDMESRSQGQCSAKHNGTTRAHPDYRKMKAEFFFPRFALRDRRYTPLYTAFSSGRTTPKYLAPVLLTPSHHHTLIPHTLPPSTLPSLSDPAAALPDAIRSSHYDSIKSDNSPAKGGETSIPLNSLSKDMKQLSMRRKSAMMGGGKCNCGKCLRCIPSPNGVCVCVCVQRGVYV